MLDKMAKVFSVSSILLVLLGVFNLQQRYYWFDLKIFDYLDASEILLSFSDILMTVFFVLMIASFVLSANVGFVAGNSVNDKHGSVMTIKQIIRTLDQKKTGCVLLILGVLTSICWIMLAIFYIRDIKEAAKWNALWFDALYIGSMIILLSLNLLNSDEANENPDLVPSLLFSAFISLVILFTARNYFTSKLLLSGVAKYDVELLFKDDKVVNSSPNRIYIDQSRHFIIFRELDSGKNIVIPLDDIKSIKMVKLHNGL